jgi:type IV secretion system protein VirB10
MLKRLVACLLSGGLGVSVIMAQQTPDGLKERPARAPGLFQVDAGTRMLLNMINSVSTKQAQVGDRLYLETAFPIVSDGRILIPQGSWVTGTLTEVKKPGRAKGKGELRVRFDSLTLPNGVTKTFRSDLGSLDARQTETLKREDSTIKGPGGKKDDANTVIGTTVAGGAVGAGIGEATGHLGGGSAIGLGAGAAAGLMGVLFTRGPDATLSKGSTVEMVLDRPLHFSVEDLDWSKAPPRATLSDGAPPAPEKKTGWSPTHPF